MWCRHLHTLEIYLNQSLPVPGVDYTRTLIVFNQQFQVLITHARLVSHAVDAITCVAIYIAVNKAVIKWECKNQAFSPAPSQASRARVSTCRYTGSGLSLERICALYIYTILLLQASYK